MLADDLFGKRDVHVYAKPGLERAHRSGALFTMGQIAERVVVVLERARRMHLDDGRRFRGGIPERVHHASLLAVTVGGVMHAAGAAGNVMEPLLALAVVWLLVLGITNAWVLVLSREPALRGPIARV